MKCIKIIFFFVEKNSDSYDENSYSIKIDDTFIRVILELRFSLISIYQFVTISIIKICIND